MASIKKRGDKYYFSVSAGRDLTGKQIMKYKTYIPKGKTTAAIRREVEKAALDFEDEVKNGQYLDGEHMTFADLVTHWKDNYASTNLAQSTLDSYLAILKGRFYPAIGNMKIAKITALHLQNIIKGMLDQGLSPATVRREFSIVSGILAKAYKWGLVVE